MKLPFSGCVYESYPKGSVTQWFGENPELYSRFGLAHHNGIDLVAPHGTPIYSVCDGTVYAVKNQEDGYGRHVRIKTSPVKEISEQWTYGHLDTITVKRGQKVKAGDQIGTMGNTGFVVSGATPFWKHNPYAGTHLHITLRKMWGDTVLDYENGVKGAIDPMPLLKKTKLSDEEMAKYLTIISLLNQVVGLYKKLIETKNGK